ncbi:MAG: hypothetical protein M3Y23_02730 [Actinomycetota bacterium]|nr:hypothetical protein [Actinomycetota bacterium]
MEQSIRTDIKRIRPYIKTHGLLSGLAARHEPRVYLAGGAVRDLLTGDEPVDLDLVVEDGMAELALELAPDALIHERFKTAELITEGVRVDIATARRETYAHPGSLPEVEDAPITDDLKRRDFTINAMAVALDEPDRLIDPHDGRADLERGVIRVLHPGSFTDDPTRALRAARYAARFGFDLDPGTSELLAGVKLNTVSRERVENELVLMAAEPEGIEALRLVAAWGLIGIDPDRLELAETAVTLLGTPVWRGRALRGSVVGEVVFGEPRELPAERPPTPYDAFLLAHGLRPEERLVNRARGAEWLDDYEADWSQVRLSISGDDLVAAGVKEGPAIGTGLAAALRARLNDGVSGIADELEVAVNAAEAASDRTGREP